MTRTAWIAGALLGASVLTAQAQTALPELPTRQLRPGNFAFARDPYSEPPHESTILLVRERSGRLRAWFIPVREGSPRLPEDERWNPGAACARFGVDFAAGVIACERAALPAELLARYRWRLDGQRLSEFVPDLIPIPGREAGGRFLLHR